MMGTIHHTLGIYEPAFSWKPISGWSWRTEAAAEGTGDGGSAWLPAGWDYQ